MSYSPPMAVSLPQPGDVIAGKFRIDAVIGKGGMGVVVAARHLDLGQRVAIKFLSPEVANRGEAVARFQREARAAARIQSEHVVRVFDVARLDNGVPYLVMEHLAGDDLHDLLETRGPLPIAEAVDYVLQACEALAEAHAHGIVHRDLKPHNLFLIRRPDGSPLVKVLDFGISKLRGSPEEQSLTGADQILGSPRYMAPEQLRSSKDVDRRADLWALGVILHRLLTASYPFPAAEIAALTAQIFFAPAVALRELRPAAPPGLEAVILRCLAKAPDERPQDIAELARALLPFAPPASAISVQRIVGVRIAPAEPERPARPLGGLVEAATEIPVPRAPLPSDATTLLLVRPPAPRARPRVMVVALLALALLALALLLSALRLGR